VFHELRKVVHALGLSHFRNRWTTPV
jgi:hypothetical protein